MAAVLGFIIEKNETTVLFHSTDKMTKYTDSVLDKKAQSALRHLSRFARQAGISYKRAHKMLAVDFEFERQVKRAHKMVVPDFVPGWQGPLHNIDCSPWPVIYTEQRAAVDEANSVEEAVAELAHAVSATPVTESEPVISVKETLIGRLYSCFCRTRHWL